MSEQQRDAVVRVLVVDDQQLMREGIASLLSIQEGIEIVGTAANGQDALEQAVSMQPDVVLMDVRMPIMDGVVAAGLLRREVSNCKILMLTTFDDEAYVIEALRAGASGYLLKDIPASDLAQAVRAVHRGIYQLDPAVVSRVMASLDGATGTQSQASLPVPAPSTGKGAASSSSSFKHSGSTERDDVFFLSI